MRKIFSFIIALQAIFLISSCKKAFLQNAQKNKNIVFVNQTFDEKIDFTQLKAHIISKGLKVVDVKANITFINCRFKDSVIAFGQKGNFTIQTVFEGNLTFENCYFEKPVIFRQSKFYKDVKFKSDTFAGEVSFEGGIFLMPVNFSENIYKKAAKFTSANFKSKVNFMNSNFEDLANFNNANFRDIVNFSASKFYGYTNFYNLTTEDFLINYSHFYGLTFFNNGRFSGRAEFIKIQADSIFEMKNNLFSGQTKIIEPTFKQKSIFENLTFIIKPQLEPEDLINGERLK